MIIIKDKSTGSVFRINYGWAQGDVMKFESVDVARKFAAECFAWRIDQPALTDKELDKQFMFVTQ